MNLYTGLDVTTARNARAIALARVIEIQATQTVGRGKHAVTKTANLTLVRDDGAWTCVFVSDALSGAHLETVTLYPTQTGFRARRAGSWPSGAVTRALCLAHDLA